MRKASRSVEGNRERLVPLSLPTFTRRLLAQDAQG